jgi:hypothetical protein
MSEAKHAYPPPPGYSANWYQVDQTKSVLISQRYVQTFVTFAAGMTINTFRFPTGSSDGLIIATLMQATRQENVRAVFATPYQVGAEYGIDLTVTLVNPAVAGEQVTVCVYQPGMNFS